MRTQNRISFLRIIGLSISALIPLAAIGLGIVLLMANTLINISFIIGYIIFPLTTLLLLVFLIFSNLKTVRKVVLDIALLVLFIVAFGTVSVYGYFEILNHYEGDGLSAPYDEVIDEFELMPALSEIGLPEQLDYYDYFSQLGLFFTCDADFLICRYSETDYRVQKKLAENRYVFQTATMIASGYRCEPVVQIEGYTFHTLSVDYEANHLDYPKRLMFIGMNDDTCEIIYLSFYDDDLDYIVSLADFIRNTCGWKHIR